MAIVRLSLTAQTLNVEPRNGQLDVDFTIDERDINDMLNEISIDAIINHLESSDMLNTNMFLKYCSLEDVFENFGPVELKNRLAQYLIDTQ
jgi:hypothetical protein